MTLVEFLEARLAEDERAARWADDGAGLCWEARFTDHLREHMGIAEADSTFTFVDGFVDVAFGAAEHIARHDPARVLREVESKRQIVDVHSGPHSCGVSDYDDDDPCDTLKLLALVDSQHPDYQDGWLLF